MARTTKKLRGGASRRNAIITGEQQQRLSVRQGQRANAKRERGNRATRRRERRQRREGQVREQREQIAGLEVDGKLQSLQQYTEYCDKLQRSYETKHDEVRTATNMINQIKRDLDGISIDVLRNLDKMRDMVDSSNNLGSNTDDGDLGLTNIRDLLSRLFNLIPASERTAGLQQELDAKINEQADFTRNRDETNANIGEKIRQIREQVERIRAVGATRGGSGRNGGRPGGGDGGGGGRRLPDRPRPAANLGLPEVPTGQPVARTSSSPEARRTDAVVTAAGKNAQKNIATARSVPPLSARMMKMSTGRGGPLKPGDNQRPMNEEELKLARREAEAETPKSRKSRTGSRK